MSRLKKYSCYIIIFNIFFGTQLVLADNLRSANKIASHGARFQSERVKVVSENIANEFSTSDTEGGDPYRRKIIIPQNVYDSDSDANLLTTKKIDVDESDFILRYEPNHPGADERGYVKYPNVFKEIERSDMLEAQNSYEANITTMEVTNALMQKTIDAIR